MASVVACGVFPAASGLCRLASRHGGPAEAFDASRRMSGRMPRPRALLGGALLCQDGVAGRQERIKSPFRLTRQASAVPQSYARTGPMSCVFALLDVS